MNRRRFSKMASAALGAALARLPVKAVAVEPEPTAVPVPSASRTVKVPAAQAWSEPFADRLDGETLWYEIIFFHFFTVAVGRITFAKTPRAETYRGTAMGRAAGVGAWLTDYVEIGLESDMEVRVVDGRKRLVTTKFKYHSIRADRSWASDHRFEYTESRRRWTYRVFKDGKQTKRRRKKIPDGMFYDDLIGAIYNMRLGGYGEMKKGTDFHFDTIPMGGIVKFDAHICRDDEITEDEKRILQKLPGADVVFRIPIDKKVFGIKAGTGRFFASEKGDLLGASVDDALGFANVFARLLTDPKQHPKDWSAEGWPGRPK